MKVDDKIKKLEQEIIKHKSLYYSGYPEISDEDYDRLEESLRKLSPESEILSKVGSVSSSNEKIKHKRKMLSLSKVYEREELDKWASGNQLVSTLKLDGLSCSLVYINGKLEVAKTRGDGEFGENILDKVKYIKTIPQIIDVKDEFEVRGEIFCFESDFLKLTEEMERRNLDKPKSVRNIVAGVIGRKEQTDLSTYFSFNSFDCFPYEKNIKTEIDKLNYLKNIGFDLPIHSLVTTQNEVDVVLNHAKKILEEGEFLIDGIVFTINTLEKHQELGETNHHPKYKMAFKFKGETKKVKILSIEWSVSRNGILTPVAEVEPVELSGATISRVTLHNYGLVKEFNLKRGDEIEIIRSGEVIPKFLSVVNVSNEMMDIPSSCPVCESKTVIDDIRLKCLNAQCPGRKKEEILNFISKIGIEDLSSKRLDELIKNKMVNELTDIYRLKKEDLLKIDKIKEKLATKILGSIERSKKTNLLKFFSSLGIVGLGEGRFEKIIQSGHETLEKMLNAKEEDLKRVEGIGDVLAIEITKSIKNKQSAIQDLISFGFDIEKSEKKSEILKGMKFCITGTLTRKRDEIEHLIKENSGIVSSSVSKDTNYLITNETNSTSSKFVKAKKLGTIIITEENFILMVG